MNATGASRTARIASTLAALVVLFAIAAPWCTTPVATGQQPTLRGQYWVSKLQLHKVWRYTRGAGVTVAVIDSGVPPNPALGTRLLPGTDVLTGGNGQQDQGMPSRYGRTSHGEEMAQIIAGDGTRDTIGIAPQAKVLPIQIEKGDDEALDVRNAAQGIVYAVRHGATVINMSIGTFEGSSGCSDQVQAAVTYAYDHDVILVGSAGNAGIASVSEPANCVGVLAVAGVESNAAIWSGSNYGPSIDLANFATDVPGVSLDGRPITGSGTSNSAAFTSGEIALLRSRFPHDNARQIVTRLLYGVDTLSDKKTGQRVDDHVGYGIPVPLDELTEKLPSGYDLNPIYDRDERVLGKPDPGAAPPGSGSHHSATQIATIVYWVVAAVAVVVAVLGVLVVRGRNRRRAFASPYGQGFFPPTGPPTPYYPPRQQPPPPPQGPPPW